MLARPNSKQRWILLLFCVSTSSAVKFNLLRKPNQVRDGDVRLSGGQSSSEGRVEIFHDGRWGTVCDDGWDMAEAQVVCRQLMFPGAESVVTGKDYGQAPGPIWQDDIECNGNEENLFSCGFKSWGVTDCSHKEDVGVICQSVGSNETLSISTHSLDHSISLSNELGKLFDSGIGCDLQVRVQDDAQGEGENGTLAKTTICAHKVILSQFPLFGVTKGISGVTVNVSLACQTYFPSFLRYIYTRKVDVTSSSIQCLHWLASKFGLKQLMEDSGRLFTQILPEDESFQTQLSLYDYAMETGDFVLQENCLQFLAWNFQNLTRSPVWLRLKADVLGNLLTRSDLVVPDEYFLLQTVEGWIVDKGNSTSLENQVDLLNLIRFPMIPAEKLYWLEFNSSLYKTHKGVYRENIMTALQFNVLLFSKLAASPKFTTGDDKYLPRIYTAKTWGAKIGAVIKRNDIPATFHYSQFSVRGNYRHYQPRPTVYPYREPVSTSFRTPVHQSMLFKDRSVEWNAEILSSQKKCSHRGLSCESVPAAMLSSPYSSNQKNIRYQNRLLLICQGKYVCQVQDFKQNLAYIASNKTQALAYPCPDDRYSYHFVVRPQYV